MKITFTKELLTLYVENRKLNRLDLRESGIIKHIDDLLEHEGSFEYYYIKDEEILIIPLTNFCDYSIQELRFLDWKFNCPIVFLRILDWKNNEEIIATSLYYQNTKYIRKNLIMKFHPIS
ncbi:MAG: hypothetical protein RR945_06715 [Erysipelotrichaceae bacterium]